MDYYQEIYKMTKQEIWAAVREVFDESIIISNLEYYHTASIEEDDMPVVLLGPTTLDIYLDPPVVTATNEEGYTTEYPYSTIEELKEILA